MAASKSAITSAITMSMSTHFSLTSLACILLFVLVAGESKPGARSVPVCTPPCPNGGVICTWDNGGNGYNGSTDCQRHCGAPVGTGEACNASKNKTCYWGWTKDAGWACFSGPPPCSPDNTVFNSAYMTCASYDRDYGGCEKTDGCQDCCSKACHCRDLIEDKSECVCGKKDMSLMN